MSKETFRDLLLRELDRSAELRARFVEDAAFGERRALLRAWQVARLARTHQDLLESRRFHDAAEFFLTDLYGPSDLSRHTEEVRRLVPVIASVLSDSGLATVAHALELNLLSESLDGAMVEALGETAADITDEAYAGPIARSAAGEFVTIVVTRERAISEALLAGDDTVLRRRPQS